MAKAKAKNGASKKHGGPFLTIDHETIPIIGLYGRGPELKHPREFEIVDQLKIYQSAKFPTPLKNVIDSIRSNIHKRTKKRYVIKKVDPINSRIWRVEDNAQIRPAGRWGKKAKSWSRVPKDQQNPDGTKKGTWGGHRVKGQKLTENKSTT